MTETTAYQASRFASHLDAEIRRLNAQVDLFWPAEGDLLASAGLTDGMTLLDCGSGPGRLLELIKRRFPRCQCRGLELDPTLVAAAQSHLQSCQLADCDIFQGSIEAPPFAPASFDFITVRLVLEHLADPLTVLTGLRRLLKPGGRLAVISNDFDFHLRTWPAIPELDALYQAYCQARREDGGDPTLGRRLPQLLRQAGYGLIVSHLEMADNAVVGDEPFLRAEGAGIPAQLVKRGLFAQEQLDRLSRAWKTMLETPGHAIVRQLWVAVGENRGALAPEASAPVPAASVRQAAGVAKALDLATLMTLVSEALEGVSVEPDDTLNDLGIDSVGAIMLQEALKTAYGVEISILTLLDDLSVEALLERLQADAADPQAPAERAGGSDVDEGEL